MSRNDKGTLVILAIGGFLILIVMSGRKSETPATAQPTACSEAAKVVTVMLAKDGYHVTLPKPSSVEGLVQIGSTDMNEHTVDAVKDALTADHDLVMQLRSAGCKRIGFYGDKLGALGTDINLDDLP